MGQASASLQAPPTPVASGVSFSNKPQAPPDWTGREGLGRGPAASSILVSGRERRPGPVMHLVPCTFLKGGPCQGTSWRLLGRVVGVQAVGSPQGHSGHSGHRRSLVPFLSYLPFGPSFLATPSAPRPFCTPQPGRPWGSQVRGARDGAQGEAYPPAMAGPGSSRPLPSLHPRGPAKLWLPRGVSRVRALQLLQEVPADGLIWPGVLGPGGI